MIDDKKIIAEIEELSSFQSLVKIYQEIASYRMKETRKKVLRDREYLEEINKIFEKVRVSYAQEVNKLKKKRFASGKKKITFLSHNGKKVAVLLSANTGLYGEIVKKTFDLFMQEVRKGEVEVTIVGRHGLALFLEEMPNAPHTFFEIPDYNVQAKDTDKLIRHIVQYEEIHIFFGKFVNIIKQEPKMVNVAAQISLEDSKPGQTKSFLFEPSLEKILMFFETEMFGSFFDQATQESQLAKQASRVVAMSRAEENVRSNLSKLMNKRLKISHQVKDKKQLSTMSGVISLSMN